MFESMHNELQLRWKRLQNEMSKCSAEGMLVSTNINLFYLGGRIISGWCYLPAEGAPLFFVRRPVGLSGPGIVYVRKAEEIAHYLQQNGLPLPKMLLLEDDSISYNEHLRYGKIFPEAILGNATPLIRRARMFKSAYEVEQMRQSASLQAEVYGKIPSLYRPGMSELELSIEIEYQLRLAGSLGIFRVFGQSMEIFMGSVIAGENADSPSPYDFAMGGAGLHGSIPCGANGTQLVEGLSVMVDVAGNFTGYISDMTRTFSIGKLPELAYRAHETALEIQYQIEQNAAPGVEAKSLYNTALEIAAKAGLSEYFMGYSQQAGFMGHGLGLEINETPVLAPRSGDIMESGIMFALEPKFVIPGVGAVGLENTYSLNDHGLEKLTVCEESIIQLG